MDWNAWKTALGLYMITPELIAASIIAGIAIFGFAWWLCSHIVKERLELLRSQRKDLERKLTEAEVKIATLQAQIDSNAPIAELSANVA
jgi:Tfp pilus assembly protein PilO